MWMWGVDGGADAADQRRQSVALLLLQCCGIKTGLDQGLQRGEPLTSASQRSSHWEPQGQILLRILARPVGCGEGLGAGHRGRQAHLLQPAMHRLPVLPQTGSPGPAACMALRLPDVLAVPIDDDGMAVWAIVMQGLDGLARTTTTCHSAGGQDGTPSAYRMQVLLHT